MKGDGVSNEILFWRVGLARIILRILFLIFSFCPLSTARINELFVDRNLSLIHSFFQNIPISCFTQDNNQRHVISRV